MAEVQLHKMLEGISGKLGDVVFKKRGGKLYVSRRPDFSKRKLSPAQKESVRRFRMAVAEAKKTLANPMERKPFERVAKKKGSSAFNTILSEYLKRGK